MQYLHTMVRISNIQQSLDFYCTAMGMVEQRRYENPNGRFTLISVAAPESPESPVELTYNWGVESYDMGTAYGHVALGMSDIYAACAQIQAAGGNVTRAPGPVKGGTTVIAFITDPDGYKVELIQRNFS